jgi:hypothetical protein
MSKAIEKLEAAQKRALAIRPKVGGFPYLAETLRRAGVTRNFWSLPACQSIFLTNDGPVVAQGTPLLTGMTDVPSFDREALISALRTGPGRRKHLSRIPGRFVAGRRGAVRRRFCSANGCILRLQWRGVRRSLSQRRGGFIAELLPRRPIMRESEEAVQRFKLARNARRLDLLCCR